MSIELDLSKGRFRLYVGTMLCAADPEPVRTGAVDNGRLLTVPLVKVLTAAFGAMTSFYLTLSVLPLIAASNGSKGAAGLAAGLLMFGGVAAELVSARMLARHGGQVVLACGLFLLGVPSLLLVASDTTAVMLAVSVVRGLGFGFIVVASGSIVVALLPPGRRGEGLGVYGVVACVPAIAALPLGVWLADAIGTGPVFLLAAVAALAPLVLRPGRTKGVGDAPGTPDRRGLLAGVRHLGLARLFVVFGATTFAGGIVVAFLPLAGPSGDVAAVGLFVQAAAAAAARWVAGRAGDRWGNQRMLVPALVVVAVGAATFAVSTAAAAVVIGALLFGAGFGVLQTATLAMMVEGVPASEFGNVNAVWNLAYDLGYGAGPITFGAVAAHSGYAVGFGMTAAVVLAAVPAARRLTEAPGRIPRAAGSPSSLAFSPAS